MTNHSAFRILYLSIALFFTLSAFASPPALSPLQLLTLTAGTQVSVMLNEAVDVKSVAIGNALDFTVRSNVYVNGQVVIAAGSIATGWVKNLKKTCGGKCIEITISVESAQAVDGQTVNLRSIPHTAKATVSEGTVNIGTNLTANVLNDIKING